MFDDRHFRIIVMTVCILGLKRHKRSGYIGVNTPRCSGKSFTQLASEYTIIERVQLEISIRRVIFTNITVRIAPECILV